MYFSLWLRMYRGHYHHLVILLGKVVFAEKEEIGTSTESKRQIARKPSTYYDGNSASRLQQNGNNYHSNMRGYKRNTCMCNSGDSH